MAASFHDLGDRWLLANRDGSFTVWKQIAAGDGGRVVGPGYLGRMELADGTVVCDGFVEPNVSCNDPHFQGLAAFAWHHYRDLPDEPEIWNRGWELRCFMECGDDPFGVRQARAVVPPYVNAAGQVRLSVALDFVDRYSDREGKRVMEARYDYIVEDSCIRLWVTATQQPDGTDSGPRPFVKEPKLALGLGGATYRPNSLDVLDAESTLLRAIDLINEPRLQNPRKGTVQIHFDMRTRLRFSDGTRVLDVVGRASETPTYGSDGRPTDYGARHSWEGAPFGFDRWASLANARDEFAPEPCRPYCKQGRGRGGEPGLTRQWELAKFGDEPYTEIMLHAWEGGSGLPDCLCCAKAFAPGERHTAFLSLSAGAGFAL
ncbi:MAG: hypothetical protein M3168_01920 [Actinomycetota bacterium]|nr:hypothetical protein [Actinomycetota bacterium]